VWGATAWLLAYLINAKDFLVNTAAVMILCGEIAELLR